MAITRAQQARQMLKKGSEPVVQGGVENYLGRQPEVQAPRKWQSGPDKPPTELAYITEAEKKLLLKEDIHGSLKDGPNEGPAGIISLDSFGDIGGGGQAGSEVDSDRQDDRPEKTTFSGVKEGSGSYKDRIMTLADRKAEEQRLQTIKRNEEKKAKRLTEQAKKNRPNFLESFLNARRKGLYNITPNNPKNELRYIQDLKFRNPAAYDMLPDNLKALYEETEEAANEFSSYKDFDKFSFEDFEDLRTFDPGDTGAMNFADYAATYAGAPGLKYSGNVGNLEKYVTGKDEFGRTMYGYREKTGDGDGSGDGGMSDYERRLLELENQLKNQQAATTSAAGTNPFFRFMADGGMTNDAPMMQGGITDLALRDEFFLGGIVKGIKKGLKGVTRAVKKVAKSPIGKAALLAGVAGIPFGGGSFFGQGSLFGKASGLLKSQGLKDFFFKDGIPGFKNLSTAGIITPLLAAPFIGELLGLNKQDEQVVDRGPGLDFNAQQFYRLAADGGLMRQQYQEGSKEPVAKKTMPLIDMGGKEKDYRETGGFVDMGRMEKADDVPARLSKNEFVFTAEAVRNAGDGDVDKGSEVMYNMMKNLESGGDVSEESQGLDGARKMFQTSQRLEEVL